MYGNGILLSSQTHPAIAATAVYPATCAYFDYTTPFTDLNNNQLNTLSVLNGSYAHQSLSNNSTLASTNYAQPDGTTTIFAPISADLTGQSIYGFAPIARF